MKCVTCVNVTPSSLTIQEGKWSNALKAVLCPEDADCCSVRWYSDNTEVATVNASSGRIYGKSAGTARIYAEALDGSGENDYCTVTVQHIVQVNGIELNADSLKVQNGFGTQLTATVLPSNASNKTLCWHSSNESVATVDENGWVCAKGTGTASITASAQDGSGISAACCILVTDQVLVQKVTICQPDTIHIGDTVALSATVEPANAENKCLIWSSSDPTSASVNPTSGLLTARMRHDMLKITATAADGSGVSDSITVAIQYRPVEETLTLSEEEVTMKIGEHFNLFAYVCPSDTVNKRVNWTTSDSSVISLTQFSDSSSVYVTAINSGTAVITAKKVNNDLAASCTVRVTSAERVDVMQQNENLFYIDFIERDDNTYNNYNPNENEEPYAPYNEDNTLMWLNVSSADLQNMNETEYARLNYNLNRRYTTEQLAFIYMLDPLGVEAYMKSQGFNNELSLAQILYFKDELYEKLFGEKPKYFIIEDDEVKYLYSNSVSDRTSVYSEAETIFGSHNIFDLDQLKYFVYNVTKIIFGATTVGSIIMSVWNISEALFFASSCEEAIGESSETVLKTLIETDSLVANSPYWKAFGWVSDVFSCLKDLSNVIQPLDSKIKILNRISTMNYYNTMFLVNEETYSINDIIAMV